MSNPALSHSDAYRPHIDGLRAIAVIVVIIYHLNTQWLPGGFVGVDLFFVISGFVVTASLARLPDANLISFIGGFYARRLTRIVPALLVMLLFTALATVMFLPRGWLSGFTDHTGIAAFFGLSNILLSQNTETYFSPRAEYNPFTHTWSLGVEEQFYLIAPFILFGWIVQSRRTGSARRWMVLLGGLAMASLAFMIWSHTHSPLLAFYSLMSRFWELAAGALLYQLTHAGMRMPAWTAVLATPAWKSLTAVTGLVLLGSSLIGQSASSFPWPGVLLPVIAGLLLIGFDPEVPTDPIRRLLGHRYLVAVGLRSYSLYLWHWPVFVLLRWTFGIESPAKQLAAIVATIILAECSYRLVEKPIRRSRRWASQPAWARNLLMLGIIAACAYGAYTMFLSRPTLAVSTITRNAQDWYAMDRMTGLESSRRCEVGMATRPVDQTVVTEYQPFNCRVEGVEVPPSERQLFVLGDSHAWAYLMLFDQLAAELGVKVHVYQVPGCPYLDLFAPTGEGRPPVCGTQPPLWQADALQLAKPGDIVFAPSLRVLRLSDQWVRFDKAVQLQIMQAPNEARERARMEALEWLSAFGEKGVKVIFEMPKPVFGAPPMRCADWFTRDNDVCQAGLEVPRAEMEVYRQPVVAIIQSLIAELPHVSAWDPLPVLCDETSCRAIVDGVPRFFDGDHVSAAGNRFLYPSFKAAMCTHLAVDPATAKLPC